MTSATGQGAQGRPGGRLDRFFGISERGSSLQTEVIAGATTFMTMAYILFVNPVILGKVADAAGNRLPFAAVLTSTALVAAVATIAMGLLSNLPLALAAGMGLNSVVAFQLVATMHLTWPQAMGVVVAEGLAVTALVLSGFRRAVADAVPLGMKRALGIGIGLFLTIIGFVEAGFVSRSPADPVPVTLGKGGHLEGFPVLLFVLTLLLTAWLVMRNVKGALLIGILTATVAAVLAKLAFGDASGFRPGEVAIPRSIVAAPDFSQLGQFDFSFVGALGAGAAALTVFSLMLSDFFDTVGPVVAVGAEARYLDADGNYPRPTTVLLVDALAATAGGAAGCSSATTYVESASGAAAGGRTGLASVVTGLLFASCLFISPLAGVVPAQATGAVLVLVGFFMMRDVGSLPWNDFTEAIPSFLVLTVMPFTYSITNGIGVGFISLVLLKVLSGRGREIHPLMYLTSIGFVVYFAVN
jgi:AGZA family xanthine/uracil permease-like MFS transporter